ncbi:hypothetical protein ES702_07020 [subsurface metagenome]
MKELRELEELRNEKILRPIAAKAIRKGGEIKNKMSTEAAVEEKVLGTVKFFSKHRFFGFITREGEEKEIFFHGSNVLQQEDLEEGQEVVFDVVETEKGLQAVKIERIQEQEEEK